ncbi:hypothetical protein X975_06523, partial [Stegodyphus mimosarum]
MVPCHSHGNGVSQHDNCTSHRCRLATEWLDEHTSDFSVINWLPRSPDLNPTEHHWDILKKALETEKLYDFRKKMGEMAWLDSYVLTCALQDVIEKARRLYMTYSRGWKKQMVSLEGEGWSLEESNGSDDMKIRNPVISLSADQYEFESGIIYHSRTYFGKAGQVVVLKDSNCNPLNWPLNRIQEVYHDRDGLPLEMNGKDSLGEFYLDDLSDCLDCRSASSTDDESDSSSIAIRKRRPVLLIYSDSEDEDMDNNVEKNNDTWSTNDKSIILEPFEGSSGVKIMPSSSESVMNIVNLFIGSDLIEHFVRESK